MKIRDYIAMMNELIECKFDLTEGERNFLDSLCDQGWRQERHWTFTDPQIDTFERIYKRRMNHAHYKR